MLCLGFWDTLAVACFVGSGLVWMPIMQVPYIQQVMKSSLRSLLFRLSSHLIVVKHLPAILGGNRSNRPSHVEDLTLSLLAVSGQDPNIHWPKFSIREVFLPTPRPAVTGF